MAFFVFFKLFIFIFIFCFLLEGGVLEGKGGGGLGQHKRVLFWLCNMQVESNLLYYLPILNVDNDLCDVSMLNSMYLRWIGMAMLRNVRCWLFLQIIYGVIWRILL